MKRIGVQHVYKSVFNDLVVTILKLQIFAFNAEQRYTCMPGDVKGVQSVKRPRS